MISIFAAITAVLSQVVIPLSPVPFSLGMFGVMLCAAILPLRLALTAQFVYLLLGAFGAPVFAGFMGGFHRLAGPTGGYLVGYLFLVLAAGLLRSRLPGGGVWALAGCLFAGALACYACAVAWLMVSLGQTLWQALVTGVAPFLVFDALKALGAAAVGIRVRKVMRLAQ